MSGKSRTRLAPVLTETSSWMSDRNSPEASLRDRPQHTQCAPGASEVDDWYLEVTWCDAWLAATSHRPRAIVVLRAGKESHAAHHGVVITWHSSQTQDVKHLARCIGVARGISK